MSTREVPTTTSESVENPLSEREMDVARLLATGATNAEIARELTISPGTVKVHVRNLFEKLQVNSRTEASVLLVQRGWLSPPEVESDGSASTAAADPAPPIPPVPEPEPLTDLGAHPARWQRLYLLAVSVLCLLLFLSPSMLGRARPKLDMLSDTDAFRLGKPVLEMLPRWEARTPISAPRSRLTVAQIGDAIYTIGGENSRGEMVDTVEVYDLQFNEWRSAAPLPQPLANAAAAALHGRVYVAGGTLGNPTTGAVRTDDSTISDQLWVYDADINQWQRLGQLPGALAGAALVAADDALYLLGGWDGTAMRSELWRMTPPAELDEPLPNWELVQHMETPRAFFGAAVLDNKIYVAGGYDGQREMVSTGAFRLDTAEWESVPPLTTARGGLSLVSDGVAVYALGGGWTRTIDTHERFDPNTNLWSNFESPISGEWRHLAAASYDGSLHLIGGWGGDYLDIHLRYESSIRSLLLPLIRND